jgi:hypothetical protein
MHWSYGKPTGSVGSSELGSTPIPIWGQQMYGDEGRRSRVCPKSPKRRHVSDGSGWLWTSFKETFDSLVLGSSPSGVTTKKGLKRRGN